MARIALDELVNWFDPRLEEHCFKVNGHAQVIGYRGRRQGWAYSYVAPISGEARIEHQALAMNTADEMHAAIYQLAYEMFKATHGVWGNCVPTEEDLYRLGERIADEAVKIANFLKGVI